MIALCVTSLPKLTTVFGQNFVKTLALEVTKYYDHHDDGCPWRQWRHC
jgi:hypothetical protein